MNRLRLRTLWASAWPLLAVTLFGLPLITPLLRWTAVPCTHDGHLHYHRVAALRHAWENGLHFSRWLPDLAYGYGYPFFVYREPMPLYAVLLPHLAGLPLPAAANLFYALCLLTAGWFMYLWVRDVFGISAGIVAAVAYMSAPYLLIDALVRGNSPESLALPLMPLLLWSSRRWLLGGQTRYFLLTVFGLAFFSLSHNISLFLFAPTLLVYLVALAWMQRLAWRTAVFRIGGALILGLGMMAWYAGGAVLEMDQVTLQQSTNTRNNDFHYNFATLGEIFAPAAPEDPNLLNPPLLFRAGWVISGLALLGAGSWFWLRQLAKRPYTTPATAHLPQTIREQQWHIVLMLIATAVYLLLSLELTVRLWEIIPLIDFVQFPWRLVGRAALPLALLAGAPFGCVQMHTIATTPKRQTAVHLALFAALTLLIVEAIPLLYPNQCYEEPFPTIQTVFAYERGTGLVGVDPEGSYFPRTVQQRPDGSPLEADYAAGQLPQRLAADQLPEGAVLQTAVYTPLSVEIQLTSPQPFTATYQAFAFPGWQVRLDGQPVPITPSDPAGLITFAVPAGAHTIAVYWGSTPLRSALTAVGLILLLLTGATAVWLFRHPSPNRPPYAHCTGQTGWSRRRIAALMLLALALLALKLLVDRTDNPLRHPAPPPVSETAVLQGNELQLAGYSLSRTQLPSGGTVDVDLAWLTQDYPQARYQSNVWLADAQGLLWSDKETHRTRLYEDTPPTLAWLPGQWAWDSREIQTLPGTPPGVYDLVLTLFDLETLQPVTLRGADGQVVGPTAVIGQIEITPASETPDFAPQFALETAVPVGARQLLGYNQDRTEAKPGDPLLLTLFWQGGASAATESLAVQLVDEAGAVVQLGQSALPPLDDTARERTQHLLRLPGGLADGRYQLQLNDAVALGEIAVDAPERLWVAPEMATAVAIPFTDNGQPAATLVGASWGENCRQSAGACTLTLLWQADAELPQSWRVFVHLLDEDGQMVAQADGEPANWTRPTTGWAAGEFVLDTHTLTLPNGPATSNYTWRIGLYDPATGERLLTPMGDYGELKDEG
jgi:hypothetical protein